MLIEENTFPAKFFIGFYYFLDLLAISKLAYQKF